MIDKPEPWDAYIDLDKLIFPEQQKKTTKHITVVDESVTYRACVNPFGELVFESDATIAKAKELGLSLRVL